MSGAGFDPSSLFRIGYGLYVLTTRAEKDNGCIVNAVMQVTDTPKRLAVAINKQNLSCDTVSETGVMNINCLTESAPFEVYRNFGYQSGRDADKFAGINYERSENGLIYLPENNAAFISLKVDQALELSTHKLFICDVTDGRVLSDETAVTYDYYQKNIKPKPEKPKRKGYICKICGYVYEGDELPADYVCPICKHGISDFEPIE